MTERAQKMMNTNEAVENKLKPRNWEVETMDANYPMLEVVDENTVKIEGVEYKKVENPKPITLQRIIEECMLGLNREIQLNLVENILDRVEVEFFSKLQQEAGYTEVFYKNKGWNNCLKELKGRLRE